MMLDFVLISLLSLRHCESRKARGNLILSALPRRFPRSLKLPRNELIKFLSALSVISFVSLLSLPSLLSLACIITKSAATMQVTADIV